MAVLVGQTSSGTSGDFFGSAHTGAWEFTASATGTAATMFCQFKLANASLSSCQLVIYADAGTAPGTRLAVATVSSGFTGTGIFSADVSGAALTINSGTQYWLAVTATGEQVDFQGTTGSAGHESGLAAPSPWSNDIGGMASTPTIWVEDAGAVSLPVGDPILFSEISGPGGQYGPNAFVLETPILGTAAQTILQGLTADAVLVTGSIVKQVNKLINGTSVVVTGSMLKQVGKNLTATSIAVTASMLKQVNKLLTATAVVVTATLATIKVKLLAMTATTVVVTASMIKQVNKALTATSVAVTASMLKQVNKILTATAVAVTASIATIKVKLLTMTATAVAVTASMLKQVGKPLQASSVVVTGSITKQVGKRLTATTISVTATLTTIKVKLVAMTATAVAVTASMTRRIGKTLSATSVVTATMQTLSSAVTLFLQGMFGSRPRGRQGSGPHDSDYQSGPHGRIGSDPHDQEFD